MKPKIANSVRCSIKMAITAVAVAIFLIILANCGGEPARAYSYQQSHVVSKKCSSNVCSAIINLGERQYVMKYILDSDGDIDDIDVLLPQENVSREEVLALKDAVIASDSAELQARIEAQGE